MNEILLDAGKLICWSASTFTNSSICPALSQQLVVGQAFFAIIAVGAALAIAGRSTTA